MLPNFLIIGAQKAATTWLEACLGEHPDVFIAREKELYFFNVHFDKGLAWYESHFDDWSGQAIVGEATPGYISHPEAAQRIRDTLGQIKLIASLRHPVDRAYSAFWHHLRAGRITPGTNFYTFFQQENPLEIRSRGFYYNQLSRYLEHFDQESVLVLIYEEMFHNGQQTINRCLAFLGLDTDFKPNALTARVNKGGKDISIFHSRTQALRNKLRKARVMTLLPQGPRRRLFLAGHHIFNRMAFELGPKKKRYKRIEDDLRQKLLNDYMKDIEQLEKLLGRDLSIWYAPS
jgi:hypothetical protein